MGKIIGIIAIKGGVGKTSSVCALAGALANDFGKKVLVVDANFTAPNLGLHLGYVKPERTIHDILMDKVSMERAIYECDHGFDLIAGSLLPKQVNPLKLKEKLDGIKEDYDIILLDSSPTLNNELLAVMKASDELLCVTTPDYPTLSCTMSAIRHSKKQGARISGLILNKVRKKDFELSLNDIEDAADCDVVAVLPDEVEILRALSETTPITTFNGRKIISLEYKKLAAALIGKEYKDDGIMAIMRGLFGVKPGKEEINRAVLKDRY